MIFRPFVGRPDPPARARENAARLYSSLHEKPPTLPEDLEIYPAFNRGGVETKARA